MDEKTIPLGKLPVEVKALLNKRKLLNLDLDFRALFDQMAECVFIIGLNLNVIDANPQASKLLGYDEGELTGMPIEKVIPFRDATELEMFHTEGVFVAEHLIQKKDGLTFPVELSVSVVHDEAKKPIYIQMIARDITDYKQVERSLKGHTLALTVIGETTAALFRSANIEERIPEALEALGYAAGVFSCAVFDVNDLTVRVKYQWMDKKDFGFEIASAIKPFLESLQNLPDRVFSASDVLTGNPVIPVVSMLIIPIQGASGSWGFLGLFDKEGRSSWLPTIFDIVQTMANLLGAALERINYEATLRLDEMRNRIIVDALPDLLIRIGHSGRIFDYSVSPNHPLYLEHDSVVGKYLSELWGEEVAQKIIGDENSRAFLSSRWVDDFRLPDHPYAYEARLFPLHAGEALIIVRDITEQARLNQMKSDFINRASHELRTPLTSAILMTELIQGGGTTEEVDQYWNTLKSELNRQKILIDRLLMAGRLESGMMKLEIQPMDLIPVLDESITAIKPIANKRKVSIQLMSPPHAIPILGDKSGLQQVFINLINNAVKFSPQEGMVEVDVTETEEQILVSISDHGYGIPQEALPHLFERFYRAQNITLAEIPGSGIGLYIVKSIVDELGGKIEVKSAENEGTTITVGLRRG